MICFSNFSGTEKGAKSNGLNCSVLTMAMVKMLDIMLGYHGHQVLKDLVDSKVYF